MKPELSPHELADVIERETAALCRELLREATEVELKRVEQLAGSAKYLLTQLRKFPAQKSDAPVCG